MSHRVRYIYNYMLYCVYLNIPIQMTSNIRCQSKQKCTIFYRLFAFVSNLRVCIYQIRQIINIKHCVFVQNANNIKHIMSCLRKSLLLSIAKFILCQLAAVNHIIEDKDVFPMFNLY